MLVCDLGSSYYNSIHDWLDVAVIGLGGIDWEMLMNTVHQIVRHRNMNVTKYEQIITFAE
jgi:hypothetical protein